MTMHMRSVVDFGRLLNAIPDSIVDKGELGPCLEEVRRHFNARAALLVTSGRPPVEQHCEIARDAESPFNTLAELQAHMQAISAAAVTGIDAQRHVLWLFRERAAAPFDTEERGACEIIAQQIARSIDYAERMQASETERTLYSDVLDRIHVGVVMLDLHGRVVRMSSQASQFITAREGLQVQAGRLRANAAREDKELQAAIKAATAEFTQGSPAQRCRGIALTKQSGARHIGLIVRPIAAGRNAAAANAAVAVYIRDTASNPDVEGDLVRQLFDLTPAEAAVARRLTAGLSLEDAAISLDISRNTARAHLRSIFSKSGITRQTELVRLVLNSAVILGERYAPAA